VFAEHAARLPPRAGAVALSVDLDGTLAPIVDDSEQAGRLPGMIELLGRTPALRSGHRLAGF
jgi:trehalose-6-phosphatase